MTTCVVISPQSQNEMMLGNYSHERNTKKNINLLDRIPNYEGSFTI